MNPYCIFDLCADLVFARAIQVAALSRIRKVNVRDVSGMLVERVFLVSGVVKTVFSHNKKK